MSLSSQIAVLLGLTALNAFFAGSEIAILSVRRSRLRELAEEGRGSAAAALALRENPEQLLATVQIGISLVAASAGAFGGLVLEQPVADALRRLGATDWADRIALALVVALVSSLSIVLGELVPKSLALRSSERFALLAARPLLLLARVARPAVWLLTAASNLVLRPFRDRTTFAESRLSPEELRQLVEDAATAGALDAHAGEIATRAIDFGQLRVGAVMVPRAGIATIEVGASPEQVRRTLRERPFARYPVVGETEEEILGYAMAREIYAQMLSGPLDLRAILRRVPFFPEQTRAVDVLRALQVARTRIGIVVDELGGLAGLVSLEDLAEELIGEVFGEHETPSAAFQAEGPGSWIVQATAPLHEVNRELGLDLPAGPGYSTLAGLLLHVAGTIREPGARISLPGAVVAEVLDATRQRIRAVRLRVPVAEGGEAAGAPDGGAP